VLLHFVRSHVQLHTAVRIWSAGKLLLRLQTGNGALPTLNLESCIFAAQVREYLEKHYEETSGDATAKLALKALTETVEASSKNIEVAVTTKDAGQLQSARAFFNMASLLGGLTDASCCMRCRLCCLCTPCCRYCQLGGALPRSCRQMHVC
jgi:hypothetical protein